MSDPKILSDKGSEEDSDRINNLFIDLIGVSTLKTLDENDLLTNRNKLINTPYSKLLRLKLSPDIIDDLKSSKTPFITAFDYFQQSEKFEQIKFNVDSLDTLTEGGIDVGSVTEIFGEAGSGKTQLCMQLALNCVSPNIDRLMGRAIYVSTDKHFCVKRLHQMASSSKLLDNIDIMEFADIEDLSSFVNVKLPLRLQQFSNMKLVVIDSFAGIFRLFTPSENNGYIERAKTMREIVKKLEQLADEFNFAIILTNHVTYDSQSHESSKAALGTAFENLVSTKLQVKKTESFETASNSEISRVRILEVIFSPRLPCKQKGFLVCSSGVVASNSI